MTTPQGKDWAVMTALERFAVNEKGTATTTFTVTNLQDVPSSVTVTVVADDVASGWFTVEEPVRFVEAGDSVSYVVKVAVPQGAPAAEYTFQLLAYSSDQAPEENPTFSSRVILEIPDTPSLKRSLKPILLAAAGVTAVAALVVTLVVVLAGGDTPQVMPSPSAAFPTAVTVPDVVGEKDVDSIADRITDAGLVPVIKYRHNASPDGVIAQDPAASEVVPAGTPVEVTVAVVLTAPRAGPVTVEVAPVLLPPISPGARKQIVANVGLSWEQTETYVRAWRIVFTAHVCGDNGLQMPPEWFPTHVLIVHTPELRTIRHYTPATGANSGTPALAHCRATVEAAFVAPLDDFGTAGPSTMLLIDSNDLV